MRKRICHLLGVRDPKWEKCRQELLHIQLPSLPFPSSLPLPPYPIAPLWAPSLDLVHLETLAKTSLLFESLSARPLLADLFRLDTGAFPPSGYRTMSSSWYKSISYSWIQEHFKFFLGKLSWSQFYHFLIRYPQDLTVLFPNCLCISWEWHQNPRAFLGKLSRRVTYATHIGEPSIPQGDAYDNRGKWDVVALKNTAALSKEAGMILFIRLNSWYRLLWLLILVVSVTHLGRKNLNWKIAMIRSCGPVYGVFSWSLIDEVGPRPFWELPFLGRWVWVVEEWWLNLNLGVS